MAVLAVIVWILTLLVALVATVIAVLLVLRVIAHLRAIDHLAREALGSIEGIGRNARALTAMPATRLRCRPTRGSRGGDRAPRRIARRQASRCGARESRR
jgi:hypothetical protein